MKLVEKIKKPFGFKPKNIIDPRVHKGLNKVEIVEMSRGMVAPMIDQYMSAVSGAESKIVQNRVPYYDHILQMLTVDSFVTSMLEKRLDNINNKRLILVDRNSNEELEQYSDFFEAPKFRQFKRDYLLTQFWGFSLFEFHKTDFRGQKWFDYYRYPNKHVNPYTGEILKHQFDKNGVKVVGKYINYSFVGDPDSLGMFVQLCLLSIYKRYIMFDYAKYIDLASENFVTMLVKSYSDANAADQLRRALKNRASGGVLERPEGLEVDFANMSSSQQNALFENAIKMIKEEIMILVLGQTMTTEDGSSRSQSEVHLQQQNEKLASDERSFVDYMNYDFWEMLPIWDLPKNPNFEFRLVPTSEYSINRRLIDYKLLQELGLKFTEEELRDKFSEIL